MAQNSENSPSVSQSPKRDAALATADLAIQQENEGLRLALREQERIVEQLTNECRRLEDRLEDRYQDIDTLRRQLETQARALKDAEHRTTPAEGEDLAVAPAMFDAPPTNFINPPKRGPGLVIGVGIGVILGAASVGGAWWLGVLPAPLPAAPPITAAQPVAGPPAAIAPPPQREPITEDATPAVQPAPPLQQPVEPVATGPAVAGTTQDPNAPKLILLNAASFTMGNPIGMADSDARPTRTVTLPSFAIGEREVTFAEYDRFVAATGARRPNDFGWGRGNRPVIDVNWHEAVAYTAWLSQQTGRQYRLPTEAEWEYAARGGTSSSYWWGTGSPRNRAVCFDCGTRWDRNSTAPTGSFPANPFGLYDTAGNVSEWVMDCYRHSYTGAPTDGSAVDEPNCSYRVARGGGFNSATESLRNHARNRFEENARIDMLGFRVARDFNERDVQ